MNAADETHFKETGVVHLKRFLPKKIADGVKMAIEAELDRLGLRRKFAKTSALPFAQDALGAKMKVDSSALMTAELVRIARQLAGGIIKPSPPQLLLTLPQKGEWSLQKTNWHLDLAVPQKDELPGVQAFVLIDDVRPRGGATLAIAGSHRLHYRKAARGNAHNLLREDAGFAALVQNESSLSHPQAVHGVLVSVVEMSGKAGDVFFMDLRVLHSPSLNVGHVVRMMATSRFFKM